MTHEFAFALDAALGEDSRQQLLEAASQRCDRFLSLALVRGVFFAACSAGRAHEISLLKGVTASRPVDPNITRLVRSIDTQRLIALAHEHEIAPNGVRNAVTPDSLIDGRPAYPSLALKNGSPVWSEDRGTVLPTRACYVGALNISLENRTREPSETFDPVSLALSEAAHQLPVTLATGNVDGDPDRTIFGWPLNPDVITVGAVDPGGTHLLDASRVGTLDGIPGPDVVANGVDETGKTGTSFAAPVVATQLALIAVSLMAVRAAARSRTDHPEGIPLAGRCFVDWDRALASVGKHASMVTDFRTRERALPALPLGVVAARATSILGRQPSAIQHRPGAQRLRSALLASARPIAGLQSHQVGRGLVSPQTTIDYLARTTIADLGALYGDANLTENIKVFDEDLLGEFLTGARQSMIGWASGITDFDNSGGSHFVEPAPAVDMDRAEKQE